MTDAAAVARPSSPYYSEPSRLLVGDLDVAYRRAGSGEPVLFLHGAGSTRMWLPFYERLSQSVDLIAPEHPGFGDTAFPDWLDGFDDLVLHYRDFLELLSLERVHLVGFSLGGWIASELAIFYPERLKSLTLITPAGLAPAGGAEAEPLRDAAGGRSRGCSSGTTGCSTSTSCRTRTRSTTSSTRTASSGRSRG